MNKNDLSPIQKEILRVVEKYPGLLSMRKVANELGESENKVFTNVNSLEFRLNLLKTRKIRGERRLYLQNQALINGPAGPEAELMEAFSLDELELRILLRAKGETFQEVADELGELLMQVRTRIITSIPFKLEVETLREAREKIKKELVTA